MQMLGILFQYFSLTKLEQSITEITTESLKKKIKPLCETRWVEKHTGFTDLNQLYEPILHCFESIFTDLNQLYESIIPYQLYQLNQLYKSL